MTTYHARDEFRAKMDTAWRGLVLGLLQHLAPHERLMVNQDYTDTAIWLTYTDDNCTFMVGDINARVRLEQPAGKARVPGTVIFGLGTERRKAALLLDELDPWAVLSIMRKHRDELEDRRLEATQRQDQEAKLRADAEKELGFKLQTSSGIGGTHIHTWHVQARPFRLPKNAGIPNVDDTIYYAVQISGSGLTAAQVRKLREALR